MVIRTYYFSIAEGESSISKIVSANFGFHEDISHELTKNYILPHLEQLPEKSSVVAEYPYVDRVYRDSFYNYYSTKMHEYQKNCIRLSFFKSEIKLEEFTNIEYVKQVQDKYIGFIILRPTEPQIIGRSVISPKFLIRNNFVSCSAKFDSTVKSIKFKAEGFPHSSQDGETITCAETCLWAVMEYFGNKYPDYKPVLPSKIIKTLEQISFERQIPSQGLNIQDISYALKEFGFGTRIYSRDSYGIQVFENLLSCYVESGIPIITAIDNLHNKNGEIAHATVCIGHENIKSSLIKKLAIFNNSDKKLLDKIRKRKLILFNWHDIPRNFVFIDDNHPVYQMAPIKSPAQHYTNKSWSQCEIKHFVVPLYPKIYLEAFEAYNFTVRFLVSGPYPKPNKQEVLIRLVLASSRSFKYKLSLNNEFNKDLKDLILEYPLPKFIWIVELSTKKIAKKGCCNGIIILDATEADTSYTKPVVIAAYDSLLIMSNWETREINSWPFEEIEFNRYNSFEN